MSGPELRFHRGLTPAGLLGLGAADEIATTLRAGGLAVLPTETGYMLAARATDRAAVARVFAVKGRPLSNPMHVACGSLAMVRAFSRAAEVTVALLGHFTPGPLTVVDDQNERLPDDLVTAAGTVGLRVPDAVTTLQVLAALGEPVTATSLNRSGEEHLPVEPEQLRTLPWPEEPAEPADHPVHVVDVGDCARHRQASTLVRVTGPEIELLREGPVSLAEVRAVAGAVGSAGAARA